MAALSSAHDTTKASANVYSSFSSIASCRPLRAAVMWFRGRSSVDSVVYRNSTGSLQCRICESFIAGRKCVRLFPVAANCIPAKREVRNEAVQFTQGSRRARPRASTRRPSHTVTVSHPPWHSLHAIDPAPSLGPSQRLPCSEQTTTPCKNARPAIRDRARNHT